MIIVKGRELLIPENERYIGTTYDDNSTVRTFRIPRFHEDGMDKSQLDFYVIINYDDGSDPDAVGVTKSVSDDYIVLEWDVGEDITEHSGCLFLWVRGFDYTGAVRWSSFPGVFYIEGSGTEPSDLSDLEQRISEEDKLIRLAKLYKSQPMTATTVAEMKYRDRIYVYVGSEEGYTYGDWYFWDEDQMAWVSGGIYNAAGTETDKTLTLEDFAADAAEVGKHFNALIPNLSVKKADYDSNYTGRSRVYYVVIPHENFPKMALAGELGVVKLPEEYLPDLSPTILVNASTFYNESNKYPMGAVINHGEIIKENELYGETSEAQDHYILYMDSDGLLHAETAVDHTAQDIKNAGAQWAITAWSPIVLDGEYVAGNSSESSTHPRTVIGQDESGNYIIVVCDGRLFESRGMSYRDIYDFVNSIGFTPRILYNLDGGGSSALYSAGVRVNSYNGEDPRPIPNVLYFSKGSNKALMETEKATNLYKTWSNDIANGYRPSYTVKNIANFVFTSGANINGIRGIGRTTDSDGQYVFTDLFKIGHDLSNTRTYLQGNVGGTFKVLIDFLPSDIVKVFGSERFLLKADGVDVIGSSVDFKTYVKNGIWFVSSSNTYNPISADSFLVVFRYSGAVYQLLINHSAVLIRSTNTEGTYATDWSTIYTKLAKSTIAANTASGASGTFSVIQKSGFVEINADLTIDTPVALAQLNAAEFPHPISDVVTSLIFSNNATLRLNLDRNGKLTFASNVTPAGGSLNSYAKLHVNYLV